MRAPWSIPVERTASGARRPRSTLVFEWAWWLAFAVSLVVDLPWWPYRWIALACLAASVFADLAWWRRKRRDSRSPSA